jgi:hypothetical protein
MPVEPIPEILTRTIENPDVAGVLERFSRGIDETVNFGTHVMKWCAEAAVGGEEQAPLLLSLRHGLELLDSISILIRQSSVEPCGVLLRALLEVLFGTQYILQADIKRRAMSFMVCYVHERLKWFARLDPTTDQGKQLRAQVKKDRLAGKMEIPAPPELQRWIANGGGLLQCPAYLEAEKEYQRLRSAGHSNPNWYSLFKGPKSIEQLAERVHLQAMYAILYRVLSGPAHGTEIIQGKLSKGSIVQIRLPTEAQTTTKNALSVALELYRSFIKYYVPEREHDFKDWYGREIRTGYTALSGQQIIHVV